MGTSLRLLVFTLLSISQLSEFGNCSKILFLSPIATKSHKNVFDPLIDALALRGHELTVISPMKSSKVPNVTELVGVPFDQVVGTIRSAFEMRAEGRLSIITSVNITSMEIACARMYEMKEVQHLMKHEKFDLAIVNGMIGQCAYGLVAHFNCPHVLVTTMASPSAVAHSVGNRFPPSFVPEPILPLSHRMNFLERVFNLGISYLVPALSDHFFIPRMEQIYMKYVKDAPSARMMEARTSLILMNSHFSLTYPRPLLPNIVEVGGMHCRPGQPLPKEMDDFLSGAEHGFILFSLGSIVKAVDMPEETRKQFINVFSKLKQRVIWKWDSEEMPDLPKNVKLSKWLPQQDILAHKNIRLFITHGGLLSTQEAVYHGVPLIGIPFFADQDLNMGQAEKNGFCLTLEILNLSQEKLETAVNKVLNEPQFKEKAQELSRIYRDQPQTPIERAVFWSEYVIRHRGAKHMETAAKELNFFQYHSIDVIAFIFLIAFSILWFVKYLLWNVLVVKCIGKLFCKQSGKGAANTRKKLQ